MYSKKTEKLISYLKGLSPVAVALSGGLDSSVLTKAAALAYEGSIAFTVDDFTLSRKDLSDAKRIANLSDIRHVIIKTKPAGGVLSNSKDRCFHCKKHSYGKIASKAKLFGIKTVVDGANRSDVLDYRPGMKAAEQMKILSPFLELGYTKKDIRDIARELDLFLSEKPSSACLCSRIPHGEKITTEKLSKVERAEEYIRKATGIAKVRVRSHGGLARIEVPSENVEVFFDKVLINKIAKRLRRIGFSHITLDIEGYRLGGR